MIAKLVGWFYVLGTTALAVWAAIMWQDTALPYTYDLSKSYIEPNPAVEGHAVTVHWAFKVNRLCPGTTTRSFYNADTGVLITTYDATVGALGVKAGDTKLSRTFVLHGDMPENVVYHSRTCFACNPLQKVFPLCGPELKLPFKTLP